MNAGFDFETWLIGTLAQVEAATAALARLGHIAHQASTPLTGADTGRIRRYLRITTAATPPPRRRPGASPRPARPCSTPPEGACHAHPS
jgi:hypothetical protein